MHPDSNVPATKLDASVPGVVIQAIDQRTSEKSADPDQGGSQEESDPKAAPLLNTRFAIRKK